MAKFGISRRFFSRFHPYRKPIVKPISPTYKQTDFALDIINQTKNIHDKRFCKHVYKNLVRLCNNRRDGQIFEEFFRDLLVVSKHMDYGQVVGASSCNTPGDNGIDISGKIGGKTFLVQCKNTQKNVGVATLRQVISLTCRKNTPKVALACMSKLTRAAENELQRDYTYNIIKVYDKHKIVRMLVDNSKEMYRISKQLDRGYGRF